MGLFDNYDAPVIYPPEKPSYPTLPHLENRNPWMSKPSPRLDEDTIYWYYGDNIHLPMEIVGQVYFVDEHKWIDLDNFLVDKNVVVSLMDFRGNLMYEKEHKELESNIVNFVLMEEDSKKVPKGTYTLKIAVYNLDEELIKILVADSQYKIIVE